MQCYGFHSIRGYFMNGIRGLGRKTSLATSLTLAVFTVVNCPANQVEEPAAGSGAMSPEQSRAMVMRKMTLEEQIEFSKQDLATRLGLATEAIKVSGATSVTWRSGALGCPKPGMNYTDVLVPGIWIVLRVDGTTYRYHAAMGGQPFYCPDDLAQPPVPGPGVD
jgi:hypothetical protein